MAKVQCNINYTAAANSCAYSGSGDWGINAADNCAITADTNVLGNKVYCYGTGNIDVTALISNYNRVSIHPGCNLVCRRTNGCFG